jgi:cell division protein FtsQ
MARQPAKVVRSPRFALRRREVRRQHARQRRRVTVSILVLLSLATGGFVLARSSLFALDGIEVKGATLLSRAEVLQASGLHEGQSMLSLHADRVRARIQRLPLVRAASVQRVPTNRVRITVVERVPSFVLQTAEARWYIDDAATLLGAATGTGPSLPTILVDLPLTADTGDRARTPALVDALKLWSALPGSLRQPGSTIDATVPAALTLERGDYDIRFGTLDRMQEKLQAVRLVLDRVHLTHDHLVSLDVRSPARPAARLA